MIGLLITGVVGQLLAARWSGSDAVVVAVIAFAVLIAFSVANLHLTGMGVVTIGLGLNLFAIMANGGMPVSARALLVADVVPTDDIAHVELHGPRHLERPTDAIRVLGDIIPMGHQVVSFGDLIIAVATADVITHLVRRQRRRQVSINTMSADHDWGIAPSPVPSSASQYSASPDADAPRTLVSATSAPASHSK
ncbi:MAG: hypothetical protein QOD92_1101 [Acidimicrobiaceae bacterium]|jgi:hypothetical protein